MTPPFGSPDPDWTAADVEMAADDAKRAAGLVPCFGVACDEWFPPEDAVIVDEPNGLYYGRCCAIINSDADTIWSVCETVFRRGSVIGNRFSVGAYTPAVRGAADPEWSILTKNGTPVVLAYDVFEAVRAFVRLEMSELLCDPTAPAVVIPSDESLVKQTFDDRKFWL